MDINEVSESIGYCRLVCRLCNYSKDYDNIANEEIVLKLLMTGEK